MLFPAPSQLRETTRTEKTNGVKIGQKLKAELPNTTKASCDAGQAYKMRRGHPDSVFRICPARQTRHAWKRTDPRMLTFCMQGKGHVPVSVPEGKGCVEMQRFKMTDWYRGTISILGYTCTNYCIASNCTRPYANHACYIAIPVFNTWVALACYLSFIQSSIAIYLFISRCLWNLGDRSQSGLGPAALLFCSLSIVVWSKTLYRLLYYQFLHLSF